MSRSRISFEARDKARVATRQFESAARKDVQPQDPQQPVCRAAKYRTHGARALAGAAGIKPGHSHPFFSAAFERTAIASQG